MQSIKQPSTEHEFSLMMEEIDTFLRMSDVPTHARPMRGWLEISGALKLSLSLYPRDITEPRPGVFTGSDLTLRIFRWFDDRYGEKLKVHMGPGRTILLIRGDPWEVVLPKVWGKVQFFISPVEKSSNTEDDLRLRRVPKLNMLDLIADLPEGLIKSLNSDELHLIALVIVDAFQSMVSIEEKLNIPMFNEVMSDIDASVGHFLTRPPHHGLSKWSSLQATEKALKGYLGYRGVAFPRTHSLSKLTALAASNGVLSIPRVDIKNIQCEASVRYGEQDVSIYDAYNAHLSSIKICGMVVNHMDNQAE